MKFTQTTLVLTVLLLLIPTLHAENCGTKYVISKQLSNVSFSIKKVFFTEQGGFSDYSGEICFEAAHPTQSRIQMTVQASSIDTRIDMRDRELRSDDFFNVARYPTLQFVSTGVLLKQPDLLEVTGDFTLHGVTKRINVTVHLLGAKTMEGFGSFIGFETEFTIDRTEFGVDGTRWSGGNVILSKDVNIHLAIGAVRAGSM